MAFVAWIGWVCRVLLFSLTITTCFAIRSDPIISSVVPESDPLPQQQQEWRSYSNPISSQISSPSSVLRLWPPKEEKLLEEGCIEVYGFFPCSTSLGGNLFLLMVYVYILLKGAEFLSSGSELLLTVLDPGLIGGLLLPILGAVPDSFLILMSGLSASGAEAQSEVLVGMGLLAGSNIMSLTVLWGGSLILGRCDLVDRNGKLVAKDKTLTKGWSLTGTGVTTDQQTRVASWIMIATVLPYLVAQAPKMLGLSKEIGSMFVLVACAICVMGLASYCAYQVAFPWIQQRWIFRAREKVRMSRFLLEFSLLSAANSWGSLLQADGVTPNKEVLSNIFVYFDRNGDNLLSEGELKGLMTSLGIEHDGVIPEEEDVKLWLQEFDISEDRKISKDEFVVGMEKWMDSFVDPSKAPRRSPSIIRRIEAEAAAERDHHTPSGINPETPHMFWRRSSNEALESLTDLLQDQSSEDYEEDVKNLPTKTQLIVRATGYLILGTLMAGVVAEPFIDAIGNFSTVTGISPFFISFVATPMATSSSEAISSFLFAMRKKKRNMSMTYSQIYGAVTMNNTLCLAVFLAIVYARGLVWDFSSEVLVILIATAVIGSLASVRVTFPSWMALIALILYPFSIALVALLDCVQGWE
ncbi:unnamed protein product [Calypogeia fissa]